MKVALIIYVFYSSVWLKMDSTSLDVTYTGSVEECATLEKEVISLIRSSGKNIDKITSKCVVIK